ncbi:MAG TPA: DUF2076 domain-containing protein [Xanthobacteraceae bacterium]|jgi:hypothetical protein|nr:DUF2076 domain-containing protein [Xanthobacteraceae bacterium]
MTPQERELIDELFDRLAKLESTARDPDAERAIIEGLRRAPNATYALVQTALVQDEALKRADARIRALEAQLGQAPQSGGGFLDNMRDALLGRRDQPRAGSVPSVRPQAQSMGVAPAPAAPWQPAASGGGSFLGTAAAAAAGVIGGSLLLDGIRSMMAPSHAAFYADPGFGAFDPGLGMSSPAPWGGGSGELAREAGIDDIGRDPNAGGGGFDLFDPNDNGVSDQSTDFADNSGDFGSDFGGGGDFGGGDFSSDV